MSLGHTRAGWWGEVGSMGDSGRKGFLSRCSSLAKENKGLSGDPDTFTLVVISGSLLLSVVPCYLSDILVSPQPHIPALFLPLLLTGFGVFFWLILSPLGRSWIFGWPINTPASPELRLTKVSLLFHSFLLRRKGERVDIPGMEKVETAIRPSLSYNFSLQMWFVTEKIKTQFSPGPANRPV